MALFAIGDVQGCDAELCTLLESIDFSAGRDTLWFVGDLVNRGPGSLAVLRRVRAMGDAAIVTLGNHDLHLLAVAFGHARMRSEDTLAEILEAPDRAALLDWLLHRPLLHEDKNRNLCLLHAGLPPQWNLPTARACAREVEAALRTDPERLFKHLYGDSPDRWNADLHGTERLRFSINCFTRLRYVDPQGCLMLRAKQAPAQARSSKLIPWFEAADARWRGRRIVFGHWSTLGYFSNADVVSLDTGCVWGGCLTALRLDAPGSAPVAIACAGAARPGGD